MRPEIRFPSIVTTEDPRTCYDLGVAYLVMGLAEKARAYLVNAAADPDWLPAASAVLGNHFLAGGSPETAAVWFRRGLAAPALDHEAWVELARGLSMTAMCSSSPRAPQDELLLAA